LHRAALMRFRRLQRTVAIVLLASACLVHAARAQRRADPLRLAQDGNAALEAGRFADALEAFSAASELLPGDPGLRVGAGMAAFMLGRDRDARRWLEDALTIEPRMLVASEWLGELHYRAGRLSDAVAVYEAALEHAPGADEIEDRLAEWRREASSRSYSTRSLHFTVVFEGPADEITARRVVDRLERAYDRIGQTLGAYPDDRITVVLYTLEQFRDATSSPEWTIAAYDGRIHLPIRGAPQQAEDLDRVLTHELAHAVVASLGGRRVPTWLNEGLATVLERGGADWAEAVVARVGDRPRLEALHDGFTDLDARDAQIAYAVSAHAVGRLLRLRGAPTLVRLLRDVARGTPFETAFERQMTYAYDAFQASLAR
jgi:tetratricopeptide (TPR) repeat protein